MKGVIWDLDGTLYDFYTPTKLALRHTWRNAVENGYIDMQKSDFEKLFDTANGEFLWELNFWNNLYQVKEQEGYVDISKDYLKKVIIKSWPLIDQGSCSNPQEDISSGKILAEFWWDTFFANLLPERWVFPVLRKLRCSNVAMGLISNSPKNIGKLKLQYLGLDHYFTDQNTVWALDLNAPKPDRTTFDLLCNTLGLLPEEILLVGDNYEKDIVGAQRVGMDYFLYKQSREIELLQTLEQKLKRCQQY